MSRPPSIRPSLLAFAFFLALVWLFSCGEMPGVAGKYYGVRGSPVASIEFLGRRAVLTTSGMLRIVFELDYEMRQGVLYLKDPANGPIAFKIVNASELRCCDSAYGGKFCKKDG